MKLQRHHNRRPQEGAGRAGRAGAGRRTPPPRAVGQRLQHLEARERAGGGGRANGDERDRVVAAILREERRRRVEPPPARSGSQDLADAAQEIEEEFVRVATLERRRQRQAQADQALSRLAAGRYGLCADCGKPIAPARLHALPFAVRCCPCQERFELRTRGRGARAFAG